MTAERGSDGRKRKRLSPGERAPTFGSSPTYYQDDPPIRSPPEEYSQQKKKRLATQNMANEQRKAVFCSKPILNHLVLDLRKLNNACHSVILYVVL